MRFINFLKMSSLALMLCLATQLQAADVDVTAAQNAARSFLAGQVVSGRMKAQAMTNLKLVKAEASVAKPTAVDYYIFNAEKSYVVIAGDDQAPEVLMYGDEGALDIDNIPPAMQWLLNKYKYQIDGIKAGTLAPVNVPRYATAIPPLVNANWDQSAPYNNQCPTSGSSHALTGCPATSLAMCYYKWKWPKTFPAVAAIPSSAGIAAAALPERQADWDNIIDEYTGPSNYSSTSAQKDAVAWLMRYAGQAIPDYNYGTSASGANDPEIYQGVLNMGYVNAQYLQLTELVSSGWSYGNSAQKYTDAQWNSYMMAELQAGRPIEYLAYDISYGQVSGHAFNVFGCDASGKYYVNWGWSGDSNGYCTLHNFTTATGATGQSGSFVFKYGEAMIIGIEPPASAMAPSLSVNATSFSFTTAGQSNLITLTGRNLTDDVTVALNDPNDAFEINVVGLNANNSPVRDENVSRTISATNITKGTPANVSRGSISSKAVNEKKEAKNLNKGGREERNSHLRKVNASRAIPTTGISVDRPVKSIAKDNTNKGAQEASNSPMRKANATLTIPAASISEDTPVNIIVTLKQGKEGTFNGTLTLTTSGVDPISVSLNATAGVEDTGGTASDAYLNIAKYATITETGWRNGYFNNLYNYAESTNEGVAWLTLPVYGAWASWYYNKSSGTGNGSGPQRWISSSISSQTSNINGNETWSASAPFVGSSVYFTSNNPASKYFGNTNGQATSTRTITFYVKNASAVKLFGKNAYTGNGNINSSRVCSMAITECQDNNGTLSPITSTTQTVSGGTGKSDQVNITSPSLDANKIYQVVLSTRYTHLYEIAFATPLAIPQTPVIVSADPGSTTADITWVGGANNEYWNLRYRPYVEPAMETISWDFNTDDQFDDWAILDIDGDGYYWGSIRLNEDGDPDDFAFYSESYNNDTGAALTPDNWLISPEIQFGGEVSFYAWGLDANYAAEVFNVLVAPSSAISGTSVYTGQFVSITPDITTTGAKTKYTFDLSAYEGSGYFVIEHHNVTDEFILVVDDVEVKYPSANQSQPEWIYVNGVTSPYTIEGLTPVTTYEVQVQGGNAEYGATSWTSSTLFTTLNGVGLPTIVRADPTARTSEITWTAGENNVGWNLRYRPYVEPTMETILWDFPNDERVLDEQLEGWSTYDADGDSKGSDLWYTDDGQTDLCFGSESRDVEQDTYPALTPDNWLFTPTITFGGTLKFKASLANTNYPDKMGVYVMPDGDEYYYKLQDITPSSTDFTEYEFDLSAYEGTGHIAFRHYESDGKLVIFLDDIEITYPSAPQGEWIYVNNVTSPYTITGLTPETTYEVQVQGVNGEYTSNWTASTLFTTLTESVTLAELVADGVQGESYNIEDGDIIAVKLGKDGKTLYCKDDGMFASPFAPTTDQTDYVVSCGLMEEYDQSNWVALTITDGEFPASILGHTLSGVKGVYSDAVNPTLTLSTLPTYTLQQIATQYAYNIYVPANFIYTTQTTAHGKVFFFMTPKPMEVLTVYWAMWDGEGNFVMPTKSSSSEVTWNEAGLEGVFTPNFDLYEGVVPELKKNYVYQFTGVVKNAVNSNSPARALDGTPLADEYEVYPLNGIEAQGHLDGDVPTSVDNLVVGRNVKSVTYYNVHGQASMTPFSGLNMVEVRYTDGTRRVAKIMK
jgi:hypothetical protein